MTDRNDPLQALMLPFASGALPLPGNDVLFLHARAGWALRQYATPGWQVEQAYKPDADALLAEGYAAASAQDISLYPLVLLLPSRQRDEMRAALVRAFDRCADGGTVVAAVANESGAKSGEADFKALAGLDGSLSKHHCRVFWARKESARMDAALAKRWRTLDVPRFVQDATLPEAGFRSRPGVFAWNRIDPASALLAAQLPEDLTGHGADLGAGWGYLSIALLQRNGGVAGLDLYEADARALKLARENLHSYRESVELGFHWHDVTAGLPRSYEFIVCNPPFHAQARADRPELGQRFIQVAARALQPGGRLFLVANRHLPYEAALKNGFDDVRVLAQQSGFKAIQAIKAGGRKSAGGFAVKPVLEPARDEGRKPDRRRW